MKSLEPKDPAEKFAVEFKFDRVLSAVTGATVAVSLLSGTDATPEALLDGAAQASGATVYQRIKSGVDRCAYKLRCEATDGTETYVMTASIGVVEE